MNGSEAVVTIAASAASGMFGAFLKGLSDRRRTRVIDLTTSALASQELRQNTEAIVGLSTDVRRIDRRMAGLEGVVQTHLNIRHHPRDE